MAKPKLTPEERKRRTKERNRLYWESHREEIALKRKEKRERDKAEKQAREKQFQEQAENFLNDIQTDDEMQNAIRAILEGQDAREVLTEYAKRKAERERGNGKE